MLGAYAPSPPSPPELLPLLTTSYPSWDLGLEVCCSASTALTCSSQCCTCCLEGLGPTSSPPRNLGGCRTRRGGGSRAHYSRPVHAEPAATSLHAEPVTCLITVRSRKENTNKWCQWFAKFGLSRSKGPAKLIVSSSSAVRAEAWEEALRWAGGMRGQGGPPSPGFHCSVLYTDSVRGALWTRRSQAGPRGAGAICRVWVAEITRLTG